MKRLNWLTIAVTMMATMFIVGCGGGSESLGTIAGKVLKYTDGKALSGVTVSVGEKSVTTGADGSYSLGDIEYKDKIVVLFKKDGYGSTAKTASLSEGSAEATINVDMLKASETTFDSTSDNTLGVTGSPAAVVISGNSLVQDDGTAPDGRVTASLTPIDPAVDINLMPGDMLDKNGKSIESYGAMVVDFKDAAGNKLNLESGKTATIRIPASTRGATALPATVPLYYFDEEYGYWIKEGTATLKNDAAGKYYEGTVTHFSYWNGDHVYEDMYIKGCVEDFDGNNLSGAKITMNGFDYAGKTMHVTSGSDGSFSIKAKQYAKSIVWAAKDNKTSDTAKIQTGSGDYTMADCLVIGDAPLKASLTWGENPRDLDTHVVGPGGFHIWYQHLGTYASDNAHLDVDDTSSYGPEVYTVRKFTTAGTYHYAVYHYAGSSTISASPARVEVIVNGVRTVFTPPSGQGTAKWWNVFDIIVDSNLDATIHTVNTWSAENAGPTADYR